MSVTLAGACTRRSALFVMEFEAWYTMVPESSVSDGRDRSTGSCPKQQNEELARARSDSAGRKLLSHLTKDDEKFSMRPILSTIPLETLALFELRDFLL